MNADKTITIQKMAVGGFPDSQIQAALGVTANTVYKAKASAGLCVIGGSQWNEVHMPGQGPVSFSGEGDVKKILNHNKKTLLKTITGLRKSAVRLSLGKGRSSAEGSIIASMIKRQHAEGSSYKQIHRLLNPDGDSSGITEYAVKAVCEFGETLV